MVVGEGLIQRGLLELLAQFVQVKTKLLGMLIQKILIMKRTIPPTRLQVTKVVSEC